jgi:hypothetical protein
MNEDQQRHEPPTKPTRFKVIFYYSVGTITLIITLLLLINPPLLYVNPAIIERANSKGNAVQLSLALYEFDSNFGSYPNDETIKEVNEAFPNHGYDLSGTSSNAAFRQLLAAGILKNEEIIQKGKCNFAYVANQSTSGNSSRPILLSPVIPGTNKFNSKDGIILVLKIDNSVSSYKIGKAGEIYDNDGLDILSTSHPIWKGKAPDIRYPE